MEKTNRVFCLNFSEPFQKRIFLLQQLQWVHLSCKKKKTEISINRHHSTSSFLLPFLKERRHLMFMLLPQEATQCSVCSLKSFQLLQEEILLLGQQQRVRACHPLLLREKTVIHQMVFFKVHMPHNFHAFYYIPWDAFVNETVFFVCLFFTTV